MHERFKHDRLSHSNMLMYFNDYTVPCKCLHPPTYALKDTDFEFIQNHNLSVGHQCLQTSTW